MARNNNFVNVGGVRVNRRKMAKQIARQMQTILRAVARYDTPFSGNLSRRAMRVVDSVYNHTGMRGGKLVSSKNRLTLGSNSGGMQRVFGSSWRDLNYINSLNYHTGGGVTDVDRKNVNPLKFSQSKGMSVG